MLYVSNAANRVTGLGVIPPGKPQFSSGSLSVAVWKRNNMLYVLVIDAPGDRYRELIQRTKIALFSPPARFRG